MPQEMIRTLTRQTEDLIADAAPRWGQGRRVRLVYGVTVTLADTEENQARFFVVELVAL